MGYRQHARAIAALVTIVLSSKVSGQADDCAERPEYRNLRWEENWRYLADPACAETPLDRMKFIALNETGSRYVSLGGEARLRYEFVNNGAFGSDPQDDNGYYLKRFLVHADVHPEDRLRGFIQLQAANESGRVGGPRLEDEDDLDLNQAFVDWTFLRKGSSHAVLRLGRQELEFGMSRLISARDGLNTRQAFDGIRSFGRLGRWNYNANVVRTVNTEPGVFDNDSSSDNMYAGASAWTSVAFLPAHGSVTLFSNRRRQQNVQFDIGRGEDERHTTGLRVWHRGEPLDYNWEGGIQRGFFENSRIKAWYFASETGYAFPAMRGRPRLGLRFDATSGDRDPNDLELNTFNSLFASTSYSGLAGQLGPANTIDLAPSIAFSPREKVRITAGFISFWRTSLNDGIYSTTGSLRRTGQLSDARHIGNQATLQWLYTPTPGWTFLATAARFNAGRFLEETPPAEDVTYLTAWMAFRF
jgi:hypothetical protein